MCESQPEVCCQKTEPPCADAVTAKVYWPGRDPALMCEKHAAMARNISNAMGFHLVIEPR